MRNFSGAGDVKREAGVSLLEDSDRMQAALGLGKIEGPAMFGDDQALGVQQSSLSQKCEYLLVLVGSSVGRIQKNDIERGGIAGLFGEQFLQAANGIDGKNACTRPNFQ